MPVRASQLVIGTLSASNLAFTQASQIVAASLTQGPAFVRAGQQVIEALSTHSAQAHASNLVLQVLVWNYEVPMPSLYPTLPGLTYSVLKRPKWFTGIGTSASGREVRVAYANAPLWEWDLTYMYLPDEATPASATSSDIKTLMGFYLAQSGSFGGFLFLDPDDYRLSGQVIGTSDGVTTNWTLVRTYGGADGSGTEPVGYVNTDAAFNVYLDGVLVDPASYALLSTTALQQQVHFNTAPAAGHVISVDMQYYYYVRFKEDHLEFEKFMDRLWSAATITLMSVRG